MEALFRTAWVEACQEVFPHPGEAAGRLMTLIADRLDIEQVQFERINDSAIFLFDLSKLDLPGMDFNVMMITQAARSAEDESRQADQLASYKNSIKSAGYCFHIILTDENLTKDKSPLSEGNAVRLYGDDLRRLFSEPLPRSVLYAIIRRQIPITSLCPYNTQHGARGAMFFNRDLQLNKLLYDLDKSYVVSGARRIGKSSLLLRAYDRLRHRRGLDGRIYSFDCRNWGNWRDCYRRVLLEIEPKEARRVDKSEETFVPRLRNVSKTRGKPLVLFFDEMDRVLEMDMANGWVFTGGLAELAENGFIRVVCAGYRSIPMLWQSVQSPFYERISPLPVPPFTRAVTDELLRRPMQNLDLHFEDADGVLHQVWRATAGYPFMVQYFGEQLFQKASEAGDLTIRAGHVAYIEEDSDTIDFIYSHFLENTLTGDVPQVPERQCSVLFADYLSRYNYPLQGWSDQDFYVACREIKRPLLPDRINKTLRNLCSAAILTQQHGRYHFAFPLVPKVLKLKYPDLGLFLESLELR